MTDQDAPDGELAVPDGVFWAAGWCPRPDAAWERQLVAQHQAGALRIHDRGVDTRNDGDAATMRRWRCSWWQDGTAVLGSVVSVDPDDKELSRVYVSALGPTAGWGMGNPLGRFGLTDRLGDPTSGLPLGCYATDLDLLAETIRDRASASALLLVANPPGEPGDSWLRQTRADTAGALTIAALDPPALAELTSRLPPEQRPPADGARLYVPARWTETSDDTCHSAEELEHEKTWQQLVDTAFTITRWNPPVTATLDLLRCLFMLPCNDEPASGASSAGPDWPESDDTGHSSGILSRLQHHAEQHTALQQLVTERAATAARLEADLAEHTTAWHRTQASRRRLATGVLRLRRERDTARTALDQTAAGPVWRRAELAKTLVTARADELNHAEEQRDQLLRRRDWLRTQTNSPEPPTEPPPSSAAASPLAQLLDAAATLPVLRFGPALDRACTVNDRQRRRCWAVLETCSDLTQPTPARLLDGLRTAGIPETLLHRFDQHARKFPLDQQHWVCPHLQVRLDHTGDRVVQLYTDPADHTVHIVYCGPGLP